jgi:hypothetical protein
MDQVQVVVRITGHEDRTDVQEEWETLVSTRIQGEGETRGRQWLQDALIAALEAL